MSGGGTYSAFGTAAVLAAGMALAGCSANDFDAPWLSSILSAPRQESAPADVAAPAAAVLPAPPSVVVRQGDTLYGISRRYDVHMRAIIRENNLAPPYVLAVGQTLVLPQPRVHIVRSGDTLLGIARHYDQDMNVIARLNELEPPYTIRLGEKLLLPDADEAPEQPAPLQAVAQVQASAPPAPAVQTVDGVPIPGVKPMLASLGPPARAVKPPEPPPRAAQTFGWPVQGTIISRFGPVGKGLRNDGINIAVPVGTPVKAADNGVVVYAGNELRGFGNLVLLKHSDGWMTAYAHNSRLAVAHGEVVKRGQVVAYSGQSGNVDRPQVHFEVRKGSKPVDPMPHLERSVASAAPGARGG